MDLQGISSIGGQELYPTIPAALCLPGEGCQGLSRAHMDGTETRQRRPEELGLPPALSTGRLPAASEDGPLTVPESQRVTSKLLGTELSKETALSIGFQVTVPFMFAGLGLSGAGILLNYFQVSGN